MMHSLPQSSVYTWGSGISSPLRLPMLNTEVLQVSLGRTQKMGVTKSGRLLTWEVSARTCHYTPLISLYTIHVTIHHSFQYTPFISLYTIHFTIHHSFHYTPLFLLYTIPLCNTFPLCNNEVTFVPSFGVFLSSRSVLCNLAFC